MIYYVFSILRRFLRGRVCTYVCVCVCIRITPNSEVLQYTAFRSRRISFPYFERFRVQISNTDRLFWNIPWLSSVPPGKLEAKTASFLILAHSRVTLHVVKKFCRSRSSVSYANMSLYRRTA